MRPVFQQFTVLPFRLGASGLFELVESAHLLVCARQTVETVGFSLRLKLESGTDDDSSV